MQTAHRDRIASYAARACVVLLGVLFLAALWTRPLTFHDWVIFRFLWNAIQVTVVEYGELASWNPWHCGGVSLWANPESQVAAPLAWPALLLGTDHGLRFYAAAHVVAGLAGAWWLGATLGLRSVGRAFTTIVYCGSGFFVLHILVGHVSFLPFFYMPAAVAAFLGARDRPRLLVVCAAILALMVLEGGTYATPYTVLTLLAVAVGQSAFEGAGLAPWRRLAGIGVLALLLSAVKLAPVVAEVQVVEYRQGGGETVSLPLMWAALTDLRPSTLVILPADYEWHEFGAHVGLVVLLVAAVGLVVRFRRARIWLILSLWSLLLMAGDFAWFSPDRLIGELPLFRGLRIPSRHVVMLVLGLAVLGGLAVDALARRRQLLAVGVLLWITAELAVAMHHRGGGFGPEHGPAPPVAGPTASRFFLEDRPWDLGVSTLPEEGRGTTQCHDNLGFSRGEVELRPGQDPPLVLREGARGQADLVSWTPNRWTFSGNLDQGGLLVVEQAAHPGWRLEGAGELTRWQERVAIQLPEGPFELTLAHSPPGLPAGILLTLLGLVLSAVGWRRLSRRSPS